MNSRDAAHPGPKLSPKDISIVGGSKRRPVVRPPAPTLERLEDRVVLAGPQLVDIFRDGGFVLTAGATLNEPPREILFRFNQPSSGSPQIDPATIANGIQIFAPGANGVFEAPNAGGSDDVRIAGLNLLGQLPNDVLFRTSSTLADGQYQLRVIGTGSSALKNVAGEAFQDGAANFTRNFTINAGPVVLAVVPQPIERSGGALSQASNRIDVFFNQSMGNSALDASLYRLINTNGTLTPGDDASTPVTAAFRAGSNNTIVELTFSVPLAEGTYRLRFGNNEAAPVAPSLVAGAADAGVDTFASAQDLGNLNTQQSVVVVGSSINNIVAYPLNFPGTNDEPGHRHIPVGGENHIGGVDGSSGITVQAYNFKSAYGADPAGNPLYNLITETQKQRAREVFELYSRYLGIRFVETESSGWTIVTGDPRALNPLVPPAGVGGIAGGGIAIMNALVDWGQSEFGGGWFQTAMHEIGHLLGLEHSYELPPLTIQGSAENLGAAGSAAEGVFPGDNDILHGQVLHRPEGKDLDLYRFTLSTAGVLTAQTIAQRLTPTSSLLDSVLTIFDASFNIVARNDNYFGSDSMLRLSLDAGTYYAVISSTGNTDYDPRIADSGLGGRSEGAYTLRLDFEAAPTAAILDATGVALDGDGNGRPGGEYNFWFQAGAAIFVDKANDTTAGVDGNGTIANPFDNIATAIAQAQNRIVVPAAGGAAIRDGDFFTVSDGINSPVTFEFNSTGGVRSGHIAIAFTSGQSAQTIAASIAAAVNPLPLVGATAAGAIVSLTGVVRLDLSGTPGLLLTPNLVRIVGNGGADGNLSTVGDNLPYLLGPGLADGNGLIVPQGVTVMIDRGAVLKLASANVEVGLSPQGIDRSAAALQILGTPANNVTFTSFFDDTRGGNSPGSSLAVGPGDWGGIVFHDRSDLEARGIFLNTVNQATILYAGGAVVTGGVLLPYQAITLAAARPTITNNTITQSASSAMSADPASFEESEYGLSTGFSVDYDRVGPEIYGNRIFGNTQNGLFLRIHTLAGTNIQPLLGSLRFDDIDIVHIAEENLVLAGNAGGPIDRSRTAVARYAAGAYIVLDTLASSVDGDYVGQQITINSGPGAGQTRQIVAYDGARRIATVDSNWTTNPTSASQFTISGRVARRNHQLVVDGGIILKMQGNRIEAGMGAQFLAEGDREHSVILTSVLDDTYGVGGTFDTTNNGVSVIAAAGNWSGIFLGPNAKGSLDHVRLTFAGGNSDIEGGTAAFNPIEIYQADARVANSLVALNASGVALENRNGRGPNVASTIFVRGAQPTIYNNTIRDNLGAAISVNANAMRSEIAGDQGRSTSRISRSELYDDNHGPLVRENILWNNALNGMQVRGGTLTTETVWDDTDVVHVVLEEIKAVNHHTFSGLRLQSNARESLVVKFQGENAGLSASGTPLDLDDRIGGTVTIIGTAANPVVLTSLKDDSVGAGRGIDGQTQTDTNNDGKSTPGVVDDDNLAPPPSGPNLVTTTTTNATALVNALLKRPLASGVAITGSQYTGGPNAAAIYTSGGAVPLEIFPAGILLTNGDARLPTTNTDTLFGASMGTAGDADLNALIAATGNTTTEATRLVITFTVSADSGIKSGRFNFQFGSDEFDEFVGSNFNDVLGGFINGGAATNFLRDSLGQLISINSAFFNIDNVDGQTLRLEYDGMTGGLLAEFPVKVGVNTLVIAIGDVGDTDGDSGIFLTDLRFSTKEVGTGGVIKGNAPTSGDWRSVRFDAYSNDRNVKTYIEAESPYIFGSDRNNTPAKAEFLGELAPSERNGDENRRLGFQVKGFVAVDTPTDVDTYTFVGAAGTEVWIDIDRSRVALDLIVELVDFNGTVLARSAGIGDSLLQNVGLDANNGPLGLQRNAYLGGDFYTQNTRDPGMRLVLPGPAGQRFEYFVRVRSNPQTAPTLTNIESLANGLSRGEYELNIRLRQTDEKPGSTIRYADIRYATNGVEVLGLPAHSPLLGESYEHRTFNDASVFAQELGNLLDIDRNTISVGGILDSATDVDWYKIEVDYRFIQAITGLNQAGKTWATIFDVDYADGANRADLTLSIFDEDLRLILVSRDSNVEDDQNREFNNVQNPTADSEILSRGSYSELDPFIGTVQLPAGVAAGNDQTRPKSVYYIAVSSNGTLPSALRSAFNFVSVDDQTRLEPINSVHRIAEDHISFTGYTNFGAVPAHVVAARATPLFGDEGVAKTGANLNAFALSAHATPFTLSDVVLFINASTIQNGIGSNFLYTVDPFTGAFETEIGPTPGQRNLGYGDLAMRADGGLFALSSGINDAEAGIYVNFDPGATSPVFIERGVGQDLAENAFSYPALAFRGRDPFNSEYDGIALFAVDQSNVLRRLDPIIGALRNPFGGIQNPRDIGVIGGPTITVPFGTDGLDVVDGTIFTIVDNQNNAFTFEFNSALVFEVTAIPSAATNEEFILSDGTATRRFELDTNGVAVNPGNILINVAGVTDLGSIAILVASAINASGLNRQPSDPVFSVGARVFVPGARSLAEIGGTPSITPDPNRANGQLSTANTIPIEYNNLIIPGITTTSGLAQLIADAISGNGSLTALVNFSGSTGDFVVSLSGANLVPVPPAPPLLFSAGANIGFVTGAAFIDQTFYVVTNQNRLLVVDPTSAAIVSDTAVTGLPPGFSLSGLTRGPLNVEGGAYANILFATAINGSAGQTILTAIHRATGTLLPIFAGGATSVVLGLPTNLGQNLFTLGDGLAFSTLDYNLWHPTNTRKDDPGHGINPAFDNSRTFLPGNEANGGTSFYFGLDDPRKAGADGTLIAQPGASAYRFTFNGLLRPNVYQTYDLPGGAYGSLLTNSFSLRGYSAHDKPTMYFNYYLNTEDAASNRDEKGMRDSFRAFISSDGINWHQLATNNETKSLFFGIGQAAVDGELADAYAQSGGKYTAYYGDERDARRRVQEVFDDPLDWRQVRVDLGDFAGLDNLRLRFDFSTAGTMNDPSKIRLVAGALFSDGESFTINDPTAGATTFEFNSSGGVSGGSIAINFTGLESAEQMAQLVAAAINGAGLATKASVIGALGVSDGTSVGLTQFRSRDTVRLVAQVAKGNTRVDRGTPILANNSAAIASIQDSSLQDLDGFFLPGDSFGDFHSPERGQNFFGEGVYIDDIIIGFAERGEMVTGAIVNPFFTDVPQSPNPLAPQQTLVGPYQLEIRRGTEYGSSIFTQAAPIQLYRSFDTNDRLTHAFTYFALPGAAILDGSTFTIGDGLHTVTFEFDKDGLVGPGRVAVAITNAQTQVQVADAMAIAISSATDRGFRLDVRAYTYNLEQSIVSAAPPPNSNRVNLVGATTAVSNTTGLLVREFGAAFGDGNFTELGDANLFRDQGQFLLESSRVTGALEAGIVVSAGERTADGSLPHPGSPRNLPVLNPSRLATGVVLRNNIVDNFGEVGIRFAGDPNQGTTPLAAVPYGRIINNTIFGGQVVHGIGIEVLDNASPTLLNNIIARTTTGISVDATSTSTVVASTLYKSNTTNTSTGSLGAFGIVLPDATPLFVNAAEGNFYLAPGTAQAPNFAVDSGNNSLEDRPAIVVIKEAIGISRSSILAPFDDIRGQSRLDNPAVATPPGLGSNIFKDRGAVEQVDFVGPTASLVEPPDNGAGDTNPLSGAVTIDNGVLPTLASFGIQLSDGNSGIGIDDGSVLAQRFQLRRNGVLLVLNVDYTFLYDAVNNVARLSAPTGKFTTGLYEVTVDNTSTGVRDQAGNPVQGNQADGTLKFTIQYTQAPQPASIGSQQATSFGLLSINPALGTTRVTAALTGAPNELHTIVFVRLNNATDPFNSGVTLGSVVTTTSSGGVANVSFGFNGSFNGEYLAWRITNSQGIDVTAAYTPSLLGPNTTARRAFVSSLFVQMLGRDGSLADLVFWETSGQTPQQIARIFAGSIEFDTITVRGIYQQLLGRQPNASELQSGLSLLQSGQPNSALRRQILLSASYFTAVGGNNTAYANAVYQGLFGRAPTTAELNNALFVIPESGRAVFVDSLLGGLEFRNRLVTLAFQQFLGRAPNPTELNAFSAELIAPGGSEDSVLSKIAGGNEYYFDKLVRSAFRDYLKRDESNVAVWVQFLLAGGTENQFRSILLSSNEFYNKAGGTDLALVRDLHRNLFGREPTTAEETSGVGQVAVSRVNYVLTLLASPEYLNRTSGVVSGSALSIQTASASSAWIDEAYQYFVGRKMSAGEFVKTADRLASGESFEEILAQIVAGADYFARRGGTNAGYVTGLLTQVLARPTARPADVNYWVGQLNAGLSRLDLARIFTTSGEFAALSSHRAWVEGLFENVLGRNAGFGDWMYWARQLVSGVPAAQVAETFLRSNERLGSLVRSWFQQYMGRTISQTDVNYWLGVFGSGQTQEQVMVILLSSQEYYNKKGGSNTGFIAGLMQDVLGRTATSGDIAAWLPAVNSMPRSAIASAFVNSSEARARQIDRLYLQTLGRSATAQERSQWLAEFSPTKGLDKVQAAFFAGQGFVEMASDRFRVERSNSATAAELIDEWWARNDLSSLYFPGL